jgi:pimeloyl-ACP methyl ester carboxylesterase
VGFSAGGRALLAAAAAAPGRFRKIALLGVGDGGARSGDDGAAMATMFESDAEPDDPTAAVLWRLAGTAGNDRRAVARYLRAPHPAVALADLAVVDGPVLLVLGDRDFAGPADQLLAALPHAELVTLRGVDHFGTPSDFGCIDAVTRFLAG